MPTSRRDSKASTVTSYPLKDSVYDITVLVLPSCRHFRHNGAMFNCEDNQILICHCVIIYENIYQYSSLSLVKICYNSTNIKMSRTYQLKVHFFNPNMIFLWHSSVDSIDKISFIFPRFWSFVCELWTYFTASECCTGNYVGICYVDIINRQFGRLFCQTKEFAGNILHTIIMYLNLLQLMEISDFFGEKWRGCGCGSWNGPLTYDLSLNYFWTRYFLIKQRNHKI